MWTHMIRSRGRLRLRPYRGVEDGAPLAVRHPPDGGAVVDAGNIAAAKRALDLRLAGDDSGVRIGHDDFYVVKSEGLRSCWILW
jgi:hypothetical protein